MLLLLLLLWLLLWLWLWLWANLLLLNLLRRVQLRCRRRLDYNLVGLTLLGRLLDQLLQLSRLLELDGWLLRALLCYLRLAGFRLDLDRLLLLLSCCLELRLLSLRLRLGFRLRWARLLLCWVLLERWTGRVVGAGKETLACAEIQMIVRLEAGKHLVGLDALLAVACRSVFVSVHDTFFQMVARLLLLLLLRKLIKCNHVGAGAGVGSRPVSAVARGRPSKQLQRKHRDQHIKRLHASVSLPRLLSVVC